jgi:hypothetical protein
MRLTQTPHFAATITVPIKSIKPTRPMKTKIPHLILAGFLGSATTSYAATWTDAGADNEWSNPQNWSSDPNYPVNQTNTVNGGRTATQSTGTPGDSGQIRIGNNTDGTLNITGGTLTASTTGGTGAVNIGYNNGATGTLNMSGGTLVAVDLNIGFLGANTTGIATVSGGTIDLSDDLVIGNAVDTFGELTIVGDSATINVGDAMTVAVNGAAELTFELGATGVSTIDVTNIFDINTGADLVIDGSNYTGGGGPIDLVTFGSLQDSTWDNITYQNFAPHYSNFSIEFDADSMFLSFVPEPSSTALLGLGLSSLLLRRKRSAA